MQLAKNNSGDSKDLRWEDEDKDALDVAANWIRDEADGECPFGFGLHWNSCRIREATGREDGICHEEWVQCPYRDTAQCWRLFIEDMTARQGKLLTETDGEEWIERFAPKSEGAKGDGNADSHSSTGE